jgi:hypothetical protein
VGFDSANRLEDSDHAGTMLEPAYEMPLVRFLGRLWELRKYIKEKA